MSNQENFILLRSAIISITSEYLFSLLLFDETSQSCGKDEGCQCEKLGKISIHFRFVWRQFISCLFKLSCFVSKRASVGLSERQRQVTSEADVTRDVIEERVKTTFVFITFWETKMLEAVTMGTRFDNERRACTSCLTGKREKSLAG